MRSGAYRVCRLQLAGLLLLLLLLAGCAAGSPTTGIHLYSEVDKMSMVTPEGMCAAILVMDAEVSSVGPGHWNMPNGSRPAGADEQTLARGGYAIYTPIHLAEMHIYVDYRSQPTREFDTVGGSAGPDSDEEVGYPTVTPGQRYLLTLVYGIQALKGEVKTVLIVYDAFPIDTHGIVTLQPAHAEEGQDRQPEVFPAVTMPLAQIASQLAGCKLS